MATAYTYTFPNIAAPVRMGETLTLTISSTSSSPAYTAFGVQSITARLYLGTTASQCKYRIKVETAGASGQLDYMFDPSDTGGVWVEVPLTWSTAFSMLGLSTMNVSVTVPGALGDARDVSMLPTSGTVGNYGGYLVCMYDRSYKTQPPTRIEAGYVPDANQSGIVVNWYGHKAGYSEPIDAFIIQRMAADVGTWETVATSAAWTPSYVDQITTLGRKYFYRVMCDADNGQSSAWSEPTTGSYAILSDSDGFGPMCVASQGRGCSYNQTPRLLLRLPWRRNVQGWNVLRGDADNDAWNFAAGRYDPEAYLVCKKRQAVSDGAHTTEFQFTLDINLGQLKTGTIRYTTETPVWTNDPVEPNTPVRAVHIMELREALDNVCLYYEMPLTDWGDPLIAGQSPGTNWTDHMRALQETVQRIADRVNAFGVSGAAYNIVLPAFVDISRPNAAAINQLRSIITTL